MEPTLDPGAISIWAVANAEEDPPTQQAIEKPQQRAQDKAGVHYTSQTLCLFLKKKD